MSHENNIFKIHPIGMATLKKNYRVSLKNKMKLLKKHQLAVTTEPIIANKVIWKPMDLSKIWVSAQSTWIDRVQDIFELILLVQIAKRSRACNNTHFDFTKMQKKS